MRHMMAMGRAMDLAAIIIPMTLDLHASNYELVPEVNRAVVAEVSVLPWQVTSRVPVGRGGSREWAPRAAWLCATRRVQTERHVLDRAEE
jgi:hypothetical protein